MRKSILSKAVLLLFLLVPASITRAQTISSQKGLITAVFTNPNGRIIIYLPDDIRPGDMISGTIMARPDGNSARQKEKNLAELIKNSIILDSHKFPVTADPSSFSWLVRQDRNDFVPIELLNVSGSNKINLSVQSFKADDNQGIKLNCNIPSHALKGAPMRIAGNFDGNYENTRCRLNDEPLQMLAESPRQCLVLFPQDAQGIQTMQVLENGQEKCNKKMAAVDMNVKTGNLNLQRDQTTFIEVKLTGLNDLQDVGTLTIKNLTPAIVNMEKGNLQVIPVFDDPADHSGIFIVTCQAKAMAAGNFKVDINLDLPDPLQADIKPLSEKRRLENEAILFGLSKAWTDAYTDMVGSGTRNELEGCEPCAKCIQSTVDEVKVNLVEKLGYGILETFTSKGIGLVGGWLEKAKKWYDKGMDAKGIIEELIKMGNLQVVVFEEKMCGYCLFSGIVFYETGTGCVDATFSCKGGPLCCNHADMLIIIHYCTDERGYATGKPKVIVKKQ